MDCSTPGTAIASSTQTDHSSTTTSPLERLLGQSQVLSLLSLLAGQLGVKSKSATGHVYSALPDSPEFGALVIRLEVKVQHTSALYRPNDDLVV